MWAITETEKKEKKPKQIILLMTEFRPVGCVSEPYLDEKTYQAQGEKSHSEFIKGQTGSTGQSLSHDLTFTSSTYLRYYLHKGTNGYVCCIRTEVCGCLHG